MRNAVSKPHAVSKSEQLLDAATALFAARGIGAVPVDEIVERADVAIPTLYRMYKGGKAGLVAATLRRWSETHLSEMQETLESGRNPRQRLQRLFAFLADWFGQEGYRGSYVTNAAAEVAALSDLAASDEAKAAFAEARAAIAEHRQAEHAMLVKLARSSGVRDPEGLAAELHVVLDGAIEGAKLAAPGSRTAVADTARAVALALLTRA